MLPSLPVDAIVEEHPQATALLLVVHWGRTHVNNPVGRLDHFNISVVHLGEWCGEHQPGRPCITLLAGQCS